RITVSRIANRRLEEIAERQFAMALRQRHPAADGAGNGHCLPTALRHLPVRGEALAIPSRWCASRGVQADEAATIPEDCEEVRTDAVAARLDDCQRDCRRERRVDCVAAAREHRDTRLRGERL